MRKEAAKRVIKQERAAKTRADILEAAINLFARKGILATTMSELAKAIKMTPGALYWHFPTKEDLLLAAIEALHERYTQEFTELLTEGRRFKAAEQVSKFFGRTQQFLRYHRQYGIFFGMVAAEAAEGNEAVATALRDALKTYAMVLAGIIRWGQEKAGELRTDMDPMILAHTLLASYMGIIVVQNLFREELQYDPMVAALDKLVTDGLGKR